MRWQRSSVVAGCLAGMVVGTADRTACAATLEFPVQAARAIVSDADEARILLDPGDLSVLDGELIVSAFLELRVPTDAAERDLRLRVGSLTTDWRGQAPTWTHPWDRAGGDLDARYAHTVTLGKGNTSGGLQVDVTQIVQEMADGVAGKHGFMLTTPRRQMGFSPAELARLGTLSESVLRVDYRAIFALGLPRYRERE